MSLKYRYIIYKIYSWTAHKPGDTPIANTILTLAAVHFFQAATILLFIDRVIIPIKWIYNLNIGYTFFGAILFPVLFYILVYNKKRWEKYIKEFENEGHSERKSGNRVVIAYLIGSILLFFIALPILFSIKQPLFRL